MLMGCEKVVVILDASASKDKSRDAIRVALQRLPLNPGDKLTLLGVLHLFTNTLGYKSKVNSNLINPRTVEEELARKEEQFYEHLEHLRQTSLKKVQVEFELRAGPSRKVVAVKAAKSLGATWIILDREMKKDKKYFLKNMSCRISKMKGGSNIEELRGPIELVENEASPSKSPKDNDQVSYDEMIPGDSWEDHSSSKKNMVNRYGQERQSTEEIGIQTEEVLGNLVCSFCGNRRPRIAWHKDFTHKELYDATGGFCPENFLSEGGFGTVFKGRLKNGQKIAVKQHKHASLQGEKEFKSEVGVLSKARHENLVMLLGSCSEANQRLLVYEYVCNASLDRHLSKDAVKPLTWEKRIKIALGAAKGLEYLHSQNIIHRDMRPSNILITHDYESLLGDFGLAKGQYDSSEDNVVGTLGYMAPEYAQTGKVSAKTDVYSFGVVLLQLITGLRTTDKIPHGKSLVGWGRPLLKDKNYPVLIDRRIIDSHDCLQLFWMVQLTEKCLSTDPTKRFTMEKVVETLNSIKNGNTTCIGDYYPISDSVISILDSFEAEDDGKSK